MQIRPSDPIIRVPARAARLTDDPSASRDTTEGGVRDDADGAGKSFRKSRGLYARFRGK